jgi:hypothetical protein
MQLLKMRIGSLYINPTTPEWFLGSSQNFKKGEDQTSLYYMHWINFNFLSTYYYIPITSTSYSQIIAYLLKIWSTWISNIYIYHVLHCLSKYKMYYKLVQWYKINNINKTIHYYQINNILSSNAYHFMSCWIDQLSTRRIEQYYCAMDHLSN